MIKYFCDRCGEEIDNKNKFEIKTIEVGDHKIDIDVKTDNSENCICKYCVIDAVKRLDDREKQA